MNVLFYLEEQSPLCCCISTENGKLGVKLTLDMRSGFSREQRRSRALNEGQQITLCVSASLHYVYRYVSALRTATVLEAELQGTQWGSIKIVHFIDYLKHQVQVGTHPRRMEDAFETHDHTGRWSGTHSFISVNANPSAPLTSSDLQQFNSDI